jgi:methionine synthase I (cobalamin-dependent)
MVVVSRCAQIFVAANSLLEETVAAGRLSPIRVMSTIIEAVAKLENLSPDRANKVVSLIDDLAELEALETEADLKAARATLASPGQCITIDELEKRLGL